MLLTDYDYYTNNFGGSSIPGPSFQKQLIKASNKVNYYTQNRITKEIIDDDIRNTTCEIAELLYSQEILKEKISSDDKIINSETVGPHSISYANNKSFQEKQLLSNEELEQECYKICYTNLVNTGLMYRGNLCFRTR